MKYEAQENQIKQLLANAKQILIVMAASADADALAAGLALYLSLQQSQKDVQVASESQVLVGHTNLYGVGDIKNQMPAAGGGNLVITLGGVAENGTAPALQRLDYSTTGNDLNLIFHVLPGKEFKPTFITPKFEGNFDLVFVLGASDLNALGALYTNNQQIFTNAQTINIDKTESNALYGQVNLVDSNSSSISEIVATALFDLQMPVDGDISSNILAGIYSATSNLQAGRMGADTFMVVAECMKRGGRKIAEGGAPAQTYSQPQPEPQAQPEAAQEVSEQSMPAAPAPQADFNQLFGASQTQPQVQPQDQTQQPEPSHPEPVQQQAMGGTPENRPEYQPSPEEATSGEGVAGGESVVAPEPDWLTPKVYKSGNLG